MNKSKILLCDKSGINCPSKCQMEHGFLNEVKDFFMNGELVVYPTETLYALGADPFDERAIDRLIEVKGRPRNMPISVAVSDLKMMENIAEVTELAKKFYKHFLPGPATMLLKKRAQFPPSLTSGSEKIGIRVPKHPVALSIIDMVGPITATSANLHGHLEPKNMDIAQRQLGEGVALYIDCGECEFKGPSTVVDVSELSAKIIRKGVIQEEELTALFAMDR